MDKYLNIQCVKGLIMSLDEQLYKYFDKDNLPENLREKIINQYYDAILEQLEQPEDENKRKFILTLKKRGIISEEQKMELLYPKHENIGDETPECTFINIIVNGKKNVIDISEENQTIDWEKIVLLSGLAKTGNEILTIIYSNGDTSNQGYATGMLDVNKSIKVKEGMIFNVRHTLKGEK